MFVLDSSVTFTWLFREEQTPVTDGILERLQNDGAIVPALWHLEVANVLIQAEKRKRITAKRTNEFIEILEQLPITTEATRIWLCFHDLVPLSRRHQLTVYDATYLDLAKRLALPLATLDSALRRAADAEGIPLLPETV